MDRKRTGRATGLNAILCNKTFYYGTPFLGIAREEFTDVSSRYRQMEKFQEEGDSSNSRRLSRHNSCT